MTFPAPYREFSSRVRPEWIDYNGHMNVAYYVAAFDEATDAASSTTIFTTGDASGRKKSGSSQAREGPSRTGRHSEARRRRYQGDARRMGGKSSSYILPIFALVSLLIAGAGALYMLQLMI